MNRIEQRCLHNITGNIIKVVGARDGRKVLDIAERRINWLRKKHGKLTAEIVAADAADKTSPLHPLREWNDKIATTLERTRQRR